MLPFNFNHLYYFYVVGRQGSFSDAARELRISQSAVSVQVKQFESSLGHTLFDRVKSGVELTDSGRVVYDYAERIFRDIDQVQLALEEMEHQIRGAIAIGTVNSIGIYMLPELLKDFYETFPEVKVMIDFRRPRDLIDDVAAGRSDFAILTSNRKYAGITSVPLQKTKMFLVAPAGHPLTGTKDVELRDLEQYPFIGYEEGMQTRAAIDSQFRRLGLSIEYSMESSNVATIKHMAMAGLGLAILHEPAVSDEIRRGLLVRLDVPSLYLVQEVTLYYKTNRTLSPTNREFLKFMQRELGEAREMGVRKAR